MEEKGLHTKLDKLKAVLQPYKLKRPLTTKDGLKLKLSNLKQFVIDSHVLGQYFALTKVNL